jgi:hypothetical protein
VDQRRIGAQEVLMKAVLWISLFGILVTVPHVGEDFVYGVPQKYGVSLTFAGVLLAVGYFVQIFGMILLSRGKKGGLLVTFLVGSTWLAGALWDHLRDLLNKGHYREGAISKFWIIGIIIWSGCLAAASFYHMRHSSRR